MTIRCEGGGVTARRRRRCPGASPFGLAGLAGEAGLTGERGEAGEAGETGEAGTGLGLRCMGCAVNSRDIAIVAMVGKGAE